MLQSQVLRENKTIIQHIAKSYNAIKYYNHVFVFYFTRAFLLDDLNNFMQIILAFSDKKLRSIVRLTGWFTIPAASIINAHLCVSICTNIFIEFTKCLWDKFVLFLELVVRSVVCG